MWLRGRGRASQLVVCPYFLSKCIKGFTWEDFLVNSDVANNKKESISKLADSCLAGDKVAWNSLIKKITPYIFSICHNMNLNREESFDIFGQVCYILLCNLEKVRSTKSLLSFIATTTKREVFQMGRKHMLMYRFEDTIVREIYGVAVRKPDEIFDSTELSSQILTTLVGMPKRDFNLIYALFFDEKEPTYEEISKNLSIPVASIGPTRARTLSKLAKILKKKGIDLDSLK